MKVPGRGCIFQTTLGPSKQTLTFWSLESRQEGILHDRVGYLTLGQIELLSSTEFPPNYCINMPQVSFNVFSMSGNGNVMVCLVMAVSLHFDPSLRSFLIVRLCFVFSNHTADTTAW